MKEMPSVSKQILYELLVYSEWKQEPELFKSNKVVSQSIQSLPFLVKSVLNVFKRKEVNSIINFLSWQLPWKLATGGDGKVVAILQDTTLEIRTARDEYTSVVGKAIVQKDVFPHLRRLEWSPDCSMVALASSNGTVNAYDLLGSNLFVIPSEKNQQGDSSCALAALIFIDIRFKSTKWSHELITIDFSGNLHSYFVSSSDGYQSYHEWSFSPQHFRKGISSVTYHQKNHILIVSSPTTVSTKSKDSHQWGISSWRLINDTPYYQIATSGAEIRSILDFKYSIWSWIPLLNHKTKQSAVFRMQISPKGDLVACLHTCGTISIWHLPSLRLYKLWPLEEQPNFNLENPQIKKKQRPENNLEFCPIDINWWSDENLTVARYNGAVTVCCAETLINYLGDCPEFLSRQPQLSSTSNENGFLALECQIHSMKNKQKSNTEDDANSSQSEDEEKSSFWSKSSDLIQSTCFFFTDMERFKPKRKRPKLVYKIYQMLAIISRTPEELFTRMIENESYEEALSLSKVYNLDSDRVYQSQWRKTPVSITSIHSFLNKIRSKTWVLYECCERVPESLSAVKELINFGLKQTDFSVVFKDEDISGFEQSDHRNIALSLSTININNLGEDAQQMISFRKKLLKLSDRLFTYQIIIGSSPGADTEVAEMMYDKESYNNFQKSSIIESTIKYARESDVNAVSALFTYHGDETLPFWLYILENIPESVSAFKYKNLLPECINDEDFIRWEQKQIRDKDWCELEQFSPIGNADPRAADAMDKPPEITYKIINDWYKMRICDIEKETNLVDKATDLLKIAKEKKIKGLDDLEFELHVLDTLVHDVYIETITLEELRKKSLEEKLQLLMSTTNSENFIVNVKHLLIPFLDRCHLHVPGSRQKLISIYLLNSSELNLELLLKFIIFIKESKNLSMFTSTEEYISVIMKCLYHCVNPNEIDRVLTILSHLPQREMKNSSPGTRKLLKDIAILEAEVSCLKILRQYHIQVSLQHIHNIKDDAESVMSLLAEIGASKNKRTKHHSQSEWNQLLLDILQLQSQLFLCMSEKNCYEIFASLLLNCGHSNSILLASNVLCCNPNDESKRKISFADSLDLVLKAARSYFNHASTVDENLMVLAKVCLKLMPEENKEIAEELDLISSLHILNEFKVVMLPMQVRLCGDRTKLIDMCIKSRENNYCRIEKLWKLAKLLRINNNNSRLRDCTVLLKCIEAALEAKNYNFCGQKCLYFIKEEQPLGWEVCQTVASCDAYKDLATRKHLAVFALAFCPPQNIPQLIQMKHDLEYKILQSSIQNQMTEAACDIVDVSSSENTFFQNTFPNNVQNLTSVLFNNKLSKAFWDYVSSQDAVSADEKMKNDDLKYQGVPEFYSYLHNQDGCITVTESNNTALAMNLALLTQSLFEIEMSTPDPSLEDDIEKLIINCAKIVIPEDCLSSLFFLLLLKSNVKVEEFLSSLPKTAFTYQFAILLFSLQICAEVDEFKLPMSPKSVVALAEKNHSTKPESFRLMKKYQKLLEDLKEIQRLEGLACGMDVARFATDEIYKRDSILGLAMSDDPEQFYLAIQLGACHNVPLTDIAVSHVTSLLFNRSPNLLEKLAANDLLVKILKEDLETVLEKLDETFYKITDGMNHNALLAYFSVLNVIAENLVFYNLTPKEHLKLIKKVKATSALIDYKQLMADPVTILNVFEPALSEQSVNVILKLIKVLPNFLKEHVSFPQLYLSLVCKIYNSKEEMNDIERLSRCLEFFNKLDPEDIISFLKSTLFSDKCIKNSKLSARLEILEKIIIICQKRTDCDFSKALNYFKTRYSHLESLESLLDSVENNQGNSDYRRFIQSLESVVIDPLSLEKIFVSAISSAPSISVKDLRRTAEKLNLDISMKTVVSKAILSLADCPENISSVLLKVNECITNNHYETEWAQYLESLSSFSSLSPKQKIQLNHILKKLSSQ